MKEVLLALMEGIFSQGMGALVALGMVLYFLSTGGCGR